ncbi:MAG: ATP-binding protein [Rikenellaceae bacterium]
MKKEIKLINDMAEIGRLEFFVEEIGLELILSTEIIMNINLALEEAIANIIMYAYPPQTEHDITLKVTSNSSQLVFLLTDEGISFDPTKASVVDMSAPIDERQIGGLGIFLIRQIMNEVTYERIDNTNKLTMKKNLS